jgi:hypothetical protein
VRGGSKSNQTRLAAAFFAQEQSRMRIVRFRNWLYVVKPVAVGVFHKSAGLLEKLVIFNELHPAILDVKECGLLRWIGCVNSLFVCVSSLRNAFSDVF